MHQPPLASGAAAIGAGTVKMRKDLFVTFQGPFYKILVRDPIFYISSTI
jgi:hypothetical protein